MHEAEGMIESPSPNGVLSKSAILAHRGKLKRERVEVPEWGGAVYVQEGSSADRDLFEREAVTKRPGPRGRTTVDIKAGFRARLVARAVVGPDGNRVFDDSEIEQLQELGVAGMERVYNVAARLWGITEADEAELVGNSESVHSDDSPTFSPSR